MRVITGLDRLLDTPGRWLGGARVGLIANPTTVDRHGRHAKDLLHADPGTEPYEFRADVPAIGTPRSSSTARVDAPAPNGTLWFARET